MRIHESFPPDKSGASFWHHKPEVSMLVAKYEAGLLNQQSVDALVERNTAIMEVSLFSSALDYS